MLEEEIKRCNDKAKELINRGCIKSANRYIRIAGWLNELKWYRELYGGNKYDDGK